ncbi:MAG: PhoH family protein [Candidatus Zixiibacteriota bacterium]|nr:MAG: PhoH family protein [candidate division Zixibacteria bacterium]
MSGTDSAAERAQIPLKEGELFTLAGVHDRNLKVLRACLAAKIIANSEAIVLTGHPEEILEAQNVVEELLKIGRRRGVVEGEDVETVLRIMSRGEQLEAREIPSGYSNIETPEKRIYLRTPNQERYYQASLVNDMVFAIGPAGTGKTYLAVAMAVQALTRHQVKRLILVRPAVEAGENLGFLPGDLKEKVDPYFRPLYDALMEMVPTDRVKRMIERNVIEVAPLAYMRGRTLSDAFVILDEAQNTTREQMMMFLTRLGARSKTVITGDRTQIDLPRKEDSGLLAVPRILRNIPGIAFIELQEADAVRHPLVRQIIKAYQVWRENGTEEGDGAGAPAAAETPLETPPARSEDSRT